MPSQNCALTPEQLALSQERKRKKADAQAALQDAATSGKAEVPRTTLMHRNWLVPPSPSDSPPPTSPSRQATVMTWNMLAQCLVRRDLFPHSNCLKAQQRENMLYEEITGSNADIICLQEVDRLEKLLPVLNRAGYSHTFKAGPRKKHGLLVAYRSKVFKHVADNNVFFDSAEVRSEGDDRYRKGSSFRTTNIALLVALERLDAPDQHICVATTHLFWHPKYTYERVRQAYILLRSVDEFVGRHGINAPAIIAGDFNFGPNDTAYALLVGDTLTPQHQIDLAHSSVVHVSIDPSVTVTDKLAVAEEEEGTTAVNTGKDGGDKVEEGLASDPDRVIKNARAATPEDGLLSAEELVELFSRRSGGRVKSVYDEWASFEKARTFSSRYVVPIGHHGANEPNFTSYTHYWKTTLDYILILLTPQTSLQVLGILEPPTQEELEPGIPQKGMCGSDHISLRAHVYWSQHG